MLCWFKRLVHCFSSTRLPVTVLAQTGAPCAFALYSILPAAIFSSIPPYCLEQTCSLEWNSIAARFQSKSSTQVRIQHGNHSYLKVRSLAGYQRSHHGHPLEYFETIRIFLSPIRSIISLARIIGILGRLDTHAPLYVKDTSTFIVIRILRHW